MLTHFRNPTKLGWLWLSLVIMSTLFSGVAVGTRAAALFFITIFIVAYYATNKYKLGWIAEQGLSRSFFFAPAATNLKRMSCPGINLFLLEDRWERLSKQFDLHLLNR